MTSACSPRSSARAIIRRDGLYSSHITEWRRLRALGGLEALGRSRGPRPAHPLIAENERLRDKVGHLQARPTRAEKVIAVQGNVSALLRELSLGSADPKDGR
jgi:transposase